MAVIVIIAMLIGVYTGFLERGPYRRYMLEWHKWFGMTAGILVVFRIVYRLSHRTPAYTEHGTAHPYGASRCAFHALRLDAAHAAKWDVFH
jgi:cytochrome b561